MPYEIYKVIHVVGVMLLFASLGGLVAMAATGQNGHGARKIFVISHGVALGLLLFAGFGLMARLNLNNGGNWPLWIYAKVVIWVVMGGALALIKRVPDKAKIWYLLLLAVGLAAAILAVYKVG